ncbi:uncharacterized protein LOC129001382 [Macrosteles quadrilineatus]|uniref:uncharacterized protein LOC129001382 n=1 Tax=Macrosteles quadrilineatus TaxID=74068 RepID=UPI0023E11164|nr:uncharacterized protein LOC129001382 [Macrosteles quadrilineatus]
MGYEPLEGVPNRETYKCKMEKFSPAAELQIVKIKKEDKHFVHLQIKVQKWTRAIPVATYCTFQGYQDSLDHGKYATDTELSIRKDSYEGNIFVMLMTYTKQIKRHDGILLKDFVDRIVMQEDTRGFPKVRRNQEGTRSYSERDDVPVDEICTVKTTSEPIKKNFIPSKKFWIWG